VPRTLESSRGDDRSRRVRPSQRQLDQRSHAWRPVQSVIPRPRTVEGLQEVPFGSGNGIGRTLQYGEFALDAHQLGRVPRPDQPSTAVSQTANAQAKGMTGDARQQFMSSCLTTNQPPKPRSRNASTASRAAIPASPRIRSAASEKAASSGETRRRVRVGLSARGRSKAKPDSILSTNSQQSVSALLGYRVPFAPE
jgi:psiF repeat